MITILIKGAVTMVLDNNKKLRVYWSKVLQTSTKEHIKC